MSETANESNAKANETTTGAPLLNVEPSFYHNNMA